MKNVIRNVWLGKGKSIMVILILAGCPDFLFALENAALASSRAAEIIPDISSSLVNDLDIRIQGKVTDQSGAPIPGATISVEGQAIGTVSDLEGSYSLVVPEGSTLVFSFIGYEAQKVVVGDQSVINVTLVEDVSSLDEVVVVGYGVQSKRNVTSSVGSVSSEEIKNYPVQQMGQALQGKVAGIQIIQNSGSPGASLAVRIRGTGTVNNSEPLYVIDGNLGASPSHLDPNQIESIEVLKSASAAAIYGAQGANGVVLITTKSGMAGAPRLEVDFYNGFQQVHRTMPMMNARQFATIYNQALTNAGRDPLFTDVESLGEGTDWQDAIFRTAPITNVGLSVAGGTEQGTYYISGGYFKQKGIVIENDYSRINFRVNSEYKVNPYITVGENLSISYAVRNDIPEFGGRNPVPNAWHMDPSTPVKNADGTWGYPRFSDTKNPVAEAVLYNHTTKMPFLNGSAYVNIKPLENLSYRSQINVNMGITNGYEFTPTFDIYPLQRNLVTSVTRTVNNRTSWDWQNTVTYMLTQGASDLEVLGGVTIQADRSENISASGQGVPENANMDPNLRYLDLVGPTGQQVGGGAGEFSMLSFLGRVNYSYKGTYLFTGNFRVDGSSKFGRNNRFAAFPSFSAGWRISDEPFMNDLDFINDLKLRGGWGMLGNQNSLSNYAFANSLTPNLNYVFGEQIVQGQALTSAGNPDLKWESTRETDIGFDFMGFNNRVSVSASYYYKQTTDMLLRVPIPAFTGVQTPPFVNGGDVLNKGFELAIGYHQGKPGGLYYDVSVNIAHNKNEVTKLSNSLAEIISGYARTAVGVPIASFYGYQMDGIFQTQEEVDAHAFQSPGTGPGDIKYRDLNNDDVINQDDRTSIGSPWPDFNYGLNANLRYQQFDLNLSLYGVHGNEIIAAWKYFTQGSNFYNYDMEMLDAWNGPGSSNSIPRVNVNDPNSNMRASSYFTENGSYLRVKHVQLGYTLPEGTINGIKNLRVYLSGQNLLTFTKYPGFDPEIGSSGSTLNIGQDQGFYPQPRTITAGINIGI